MSPWRAAIDQALLLQKQPALASAFKQTSLPEGMSIVIRLASDEGGRKKDLAQLLEIDEAQLQIAAAEYLLQICLYPGSSDLRVLGVNSGADLKVIKEQHRLLLKWLHPDRNPDNQALAERVNQAWAALKNVSKESSAIAYPFEVNDSREELPALPAGRFPLFLWGLIGLVLMLLVISLLPDSEIYVAESDLTERAALEPVNGTVDSATDSQLEQKLSALKHSFGTIKNSVLSSDKPKIKAAAKPVKVNASSQKNSKSPTASPPAILPSKAPAVIKRDTVLTKISKPMPSNGLSSASLPAVAPLPSTEPEPIITPARNLKAESQDVLARFRQYYKQGNLQVFMANFSSSARNNRGDRQAIEADYARFFSQTSSRKISFSDEKWTVREDVVQYKARYSATARRKGELIPDASNGRIEFVMSIENGKLLIQHVLLND